MAPLQRSPAPRRWRRIDIRVSELIVFLVAAVGAVALGLGITSYFGEHPYTLAYLIAYAGFRFADVMVREDFEPPPDAALLSGSILRQLPVLLLFAAAPFERTFLYGGEVARWVQALGLLMELLGLWLALGARIQLGFFSSTPESGGPRALVRNGLYGSIRHPIWLGEFLVVFAWALEFGAPVSAVLDDHIRGGDGPDARPRRKRPRCWRSSATSTRAICRRPSPSSPASGSGFGIFESHPLIVG